MARDKIKELLISTQLPVAYRAFKKYKNKPPPDLPYIIYLYTREHHSGSDKKNNLVKKNILVELYADTKDEIAEQKVEKVLNAFEFEKDEIYIELENLYQVRYEFEIYQKL